jgi:hypothetical protein
MHAAVRWLLVVVAALAMLIGAASVVSGGAGPGWWFLAAGAAGLVIVALERSRYSPAAAERRRADVAATPTTEKGEAGLEARFVPTDERFVDPTTGRRLRVYFDGHTGERRYQADEQEPD